MCLEPLSQWIVVAVLLAQTPTDASSASSATPMQPDVAAAALPEVIITGHAVFAIPFRVDSPAEPARQPAEIQLHVSNDRGAHWQLYARVPPTQQQFMFRAGVDGEYWFVIRTLDRSGQLRPETIGAPGLRVLVDTRPPNLEVTAQLVEPGQVSVRWEIDKKTLKADSLSLQYRALPKGPWKAVALNPPGVSAANAAADGAATIWLQPGEGDIQIRAEVADTAGNIGFGHAQVLADGPPQPQRNLASVPSQPAVQSAGGEPPAQTPRANPTTRAALSAHVARAEPQSKRDPLEDADPKGSVAITINPAIGRQVISADEPSSVLASTSGLPNGERPRMVNSRLFELEYDVDSIGPSGVGRVELWGTQDGGQTWRSYPVADDHRSPLLVSVDDEGIYGFRLVVTNGAGIGGKPPASGDAPDIWVGVDVTKPTARIISVQQGVDAEAGRVIITWRADDKMLAARPISLAFSQSPAGPWLPIAGGLENTGRYAWAIDSHTPAEVYVRLEARDEAGNVGVCTTSEPLSIDQSHPSVRIRDVRSLGHTGLRPTRESSDSTSRQ